MTRYQKTVVTSALIFLPAGLAAGLFYSLTPWSSWAANLAVALLIFGAAYVVNQLVLTRQLQRRFAAAFERADPDAADLVLEEVAEMWPRNRKMLAYVEANRAVVLMLRERWDEAVAVARRSAAGEMTSAHAALLQNNLAWALAHAGALDEAGGLAQRALDGARTEVVRAAAQGTLGAIWALKGDADRALALLDAAVGSALGGGAAMSARHYYRGVALESKRSAADALRAYEAARAAAPQSQFGRKASARIAQLQSKP